MTRMRRSSEQFGWFHVTNRGVDKQDIFLDEEDRDRFVELMVEAADRFEIEIHAFGLMSNHFHLIVHCPKGSLSDFMKRLLRRYAQQHNRRVDRCGHLFSGRFRSTVLDEERTGWDPVSDQSDSLLVSGRYVHRNQLDSAPLAEVRHSRFSSYGCYLGLRATPSWLTTDRLLALHDHDRRELGIFTERQHESDKTPKGGREAIPYTPREVIDAVSVVVGVSTSSVARVPSGKANELRDLAAHLCIVLRTGDPETLRHVFGLASQSAFRRLAARGKDRCGSDDRHATRRDLVVSELWRAHVAEGRRAA